jgi:hypothetical protein
MAPTSTTARTPTSATTITVATRTTFLIPVRLRAVVITNAPAVHTQAGIDGTKECIARPVNRYATLGIST